MKNYLFSCFYIIAKTVMETNKTGKLFFLSIEKFG